MQTLRLLSLFALSTFLLSGCNKENRDTTIVHESRTLESFDRLTVSGSWEVTLIRSNENRIEIDAEQRIIDYLKTDVRDGGLEVGVRCCRSPEKTIKATIYTNTPLNSVGISGSSTVECSDTMTVNRFELSMSGSGKSDFIVQVADLYIDMNGSGNATFLVVNSNEIRSNLSGSGRVQMDGKTINQKVSISGSGNYNGFGLSSETADVDISGSGEAQLWVEKSLMARITGSGTVRYRGNPTVSSDITGSGKVIKE